MQEDLVQYGDLCEHFTFNRKYATAPLLILGPTGTGVMFSFLGLTGTEAMPFLLLLTGTEACLLYCY